jgi:endonuclease/exonuclease/phosphatase family metal-dependent hydrolase
MIKTAVALFVMCAALLGGTTVKLATYNVENLFDLHYDGTEYLEYIPDSSWQWNRETYGKKLRNLARVIAEMNADVIALQEIESAEALRDLKKAVKRAGCYYPHMAFASGKNTTVKVALLSKLPIETTREVSIGATRKYRNILEARIRVETETLFLYVNHWKSKSGPESQRIISAKALRTRLDAIGHHHPIVLLGDFNSHYAESEIFVRKRKHNDTDGVTGINHILKTLNGTDPVSLKSLSHCGDCYYNLWYELPEKARWSHNFYGQKEGLDNIIISPGLHDGKGIEYVTGSFHKFAPNYLFKKRSIYRWQRSKKYPKHHTGKGYSDHLPITAELTVVK